MIMSQHAALYQLEIQTDLMLEFFRR